ncbi:MAG: hypothetical protein K6G03_01735 [Lachnospiraceae bacterium]|nr:hypothetical protein [Lachnospiraceae bacterium]
MRLTVPIIIIIFCVIFKLIVNRKPKRDPDAEFIELERKANLTPRKDISNLPYIVVPVGSLPLDLPIDKEEVRERQEIIRSMAEKKVLNLTGKTNTELKLEYGAPNINILSAADSNYTRLVQAISYLASDYYNAGYKNEAKALLEYGISIKTDSKKNYLLLASIYNKSNESEKISGLISCAESIDSLLKDNIIQALKEIDSIPSDIDN